MYMKTITVSGAIILRKNPETSRPEIFATQRGYGDWKGWWEIPGGKLEPGETPEQCIVREIREELATEVKAEKILGVVDYDYPTFHLTMHCCNTQRKKRFFEAITHLVKNHAMCKSFAHSVFLFMAASSIQV